MNIYVISCFLTLSVIWVELGFVGVFIDAACHIYLFVALLFAMWAVNKDGNDGIASMNAAIVVIAPVVASLSGLISTVVEIIATGAPGLSGMQ